MAEHQIKILSELGNKNQSEDKTTELLKIKASPDQEAHDAGLAWQMSTPPKERKKFTLSITSRILAELAESSPNIESEMKETVPLRPRFNPDQEAINAVLKATEKEF